MPGPVGRIVMPVVMVASVVALASPALAANAIGPNQSFVGQVNGKHTDAVVQVVCPGPVRPGQVGPPVGNQTVAVSPSPAGVGPGFTGTAGHRVVVRFVDDPSAKVTLTAYDTPSLIPTSLRLPCQGTGRVRFVPKPTSPSARADVVTVTYQNIGV